MPPPVPRRRRWLGLPPRIALGFAAATAALLVAGAFSAFALRSRSHASALVADGKARELALEEVESVLLVAHASLDAWLGTGAASHREVHARAAAKLAPALAELARLSAGEADDEARLSRLVPEVALARAEQERALALADSGDRQGALSLRQAGAGSLAVERAKVVVEELEASGARVAGKRQVAAARIGAVSNTGFLLAQGVVLVLVGFAVRLVRDEIRAREENEAARERALAVQQRLMAVVSHDLRNPLTGILAAGWALSRARLPEPEALLARRIVGAGRRMERLIRDLLDWTRVHGGAEIPVSPCEADLGAVCRRIVDELGDREPHRLHLVHAGDTRGVFDPDRMEQVVANLVGNALKYSPLDAPVEVRAVGDGEEVRLEVRDHGPGIPPEARRRLFEAFQRGHPELDREGGLGLGLFIVRTLVEAQGGSVAVEGAPGTGTTFVVRLPRNAAGTGRHDLAARAR